MEYWGADTPALHYSTSNPSEDENEDDHDYETKSQMRMHKINTHQLTEEPWTSPKGKFSAIGRQVSQALGRKPQSTDLLERHPFDIEISRIPPGKPNYPTIRTARNGSSTT